MIENKNYKYNYQKVDEDMMITYIFCGLLLVSALILFCLSIMLVFGVDTVLGWIGYRPEYLNAW